MGVALKQEVEIWGVGREAKNFGGREERGQRKRIKNNGIEISGVLQQEEQGQQEQGNTPVHSPLCHTRHMKRKHASPAAQRPPCSVQL